MPGEIVVWSGAGGGGGGAGASPDCCARAGDDVMLSARRPAIIKAWGEDDAGIAAISSFSGEREPHGLRSSNIFFACEVTKISV